MGDEQRTDEQFTVEHQPEHNRYALLDGDTVAGVAEYQDRDTDTGRNRIFHHTEVDPAYGGRGLAGVLVTGALEDSTADDATTIVPVCSYVQRFVAKHPEFAGRVADSSAEDMNALDRLAD